MKKFLTVLFAVMMVLCLAGCAKEEAKEEAPEAETVTAKGVYNVANNTGANVGGVYIYPVGSEDKGENYVSKILADSHYTYLQNFKSITIDASVDSKFAEWTGVEEEKPHFVFEFYAYDGDAADQCGEMIGKFDNLALEEATIVLINEDMRTGATEIAWGGKDYNEFEMAVDFYNSTGKDVTSLKVYMTGTKDLVADVLADAGMEVFAAGEGPLTWKHSESIADANTVHYDVEWTTVDGETLTLGVDDTHPLSFENTAMQLLNKATMPDYNSGATTVVWLNPNITPVTPK